ncbi:MAG TPA: hypothetical protein EYO76_07305 [Flavobacteriaceae bacterium]|nr:hypothetical protein [Flavobacteriaceae bacterium]
MTVIAFLVFMLRSDLKRGKIILISFVFFFTSEFLVLNYEDLTFSMLSSVFKIIAYLILLKYVITKFDYKRTNVYLLAFFAVLALLNLYALQGITNFISIIDNNLILKYIIYFHGIVLLCYFSGSLNFIHPSKLSVYLTLFVFGFAFSDLCAVLAFHFDVDSLAVIHRILLVFSSYFAIKYMISDNQKVNIDYLED